MKVCRTGVHMVYIRGMFVLSHVPRVCNWVYGLCACDCWGIDEEGEGVLGGLHLQHGMLALHGRRCTWHSPL